MLLGFMQKFPWKGEDKQPVPTNFREKILAGAGYLMSSQILSDEIKNKLGVITHPDSIYTPKIHTFREDPYNRWKLGMSIQMVYRGPKYSILDHFNKGIPELERCVSVQKIKIEWFSYHMKPLEIMSIKGGTSRVPVVKIDDRELSGMELEKLAANDGFDSVEDFFRWFKRDWSGKCLHWTDFRY